MSKRTRREFLEDSMFATAAALAAGSATNVFAVEEVETRSAGEHLSVAVVGVKGRGNSHISAFTRFGDTRVTHICDVDEKVGMRAVENAAQRQGGLRPKFVRDIRELCDDASIDVVTIATPNHWHALAAIWAMQAGKDVYVEKPVSHNVSEGRRIVQTARKEKRICQVGTQARSSVGTQQGIQFVLDGGIGEVKLARGLCYKRRTSIGSKGDYPVPKEVDYDLWCGPAPVLPVTRPQFHYDWHWQFFYGNGDVGNQGPHQWDIARWGLGIDRLPDNVISYGGRLGYEDAGDTANTQVVVEEFGDKTLVFEVRGLKTDGYKGAKIGVIFEGSEGYLVSTSNYGGTTAFDTEGKVMKTFKGGGNHFRNFTDAVRSRKREDLNADATEGHLSASLAHLGNISYQLGQEINVREALERMQSLTTSDDVQDTFDRTRQHLADNGVDLKETRLRLGPHLALDAEAERFVDNSQADALLTREYRAPFIVPTADQI